MPEPASRFYFDFVDPLSYLTELAIRDLEASRGIEVERVGYELRPPPAPLTDFHDSFWSARWGAARLAGAGIPWNPAALVPWTRKAHELQLFADERGVGAVIRQAIFEAYLERARDIGRIDELVEIARAKGLDPSETKAVLDVDRHREQLLDIRREADSLGLVELPALLVHGGLVQGFRNPTDLSTLFRGPS
jgi:predicted DsbA family dithiol-disulfide isomerase